MQRRVVVSLVGGLALLAVVPLVCSRLSLNRFETQFSSGRAEYEAAVHWANGQNTRGWVELPPQFRRLSKSGSVMLFGNAPDRLVLFDIAEGHDWVQYIGWAEPENAKIQDLPAIRAMPDYVMFTERRIDSHWHIAGAMP